MQIRPATPDDAEAVHGVATAAWETDYPGIIDQERATEAAREWYDPGRMREAIDDDRTVVLVGDLDGDVVGFAHAALSTERSVGSILRLYVHPDHRRGGLGRALLEETVDGLLDRDVDRVEAMVLEENERGNEFYRDAGFELDDAGETRIVGEPYGENVYVYRG